MIEIKLIKINQPIGLFFVGKLSSKDIYNISVVNRVSENNGIQRKLNNIKVNEIAKYCEDPDATFPTPIILNVDTLSNDKSIILKEIDEDLYSLKISDKKKTCEIIDGQHRIYGINESHKEIMMPVVFMFDLTEEEKAYVFSTINANQTKVDKSTIYQLFDLSTNRSPYKTCHDIARIMNNSKNSPFFNKLKMLGYRKDKMQSLSQGTFVTELVKLISKDNKQANQDMIDIKNHKQLKAIDNIPFRKYFIYEKDDIIYKILNNYFSAIRDVFCEEWNSDKYILTKTTGFGALLMVLKDLFYVGESKKDLSYDFFKNHFIAVRKEFNNQNKLFTSKFYSSGVQEQKKLYNDIMKCFH